MGPAILAISLKQPWANRIASGEKTLETRTWTTVHRGPLLIVSSKRPNIPPAGQAVAIVNLVACRPMTLDDEAAACCKIYEGAYVWVLEDMRRIEPFPVKGKQKLYRVELSEKERESVMVKTAIKDEPEGEETTEETTEEETTEEETEGEENTTESLATDPEAMVKKVAEQRLLDQKVDELLIAIMPMGSIEIGGSIDAANIRLDKTDIDLKITISRTGDNFVKLSRMFGDRKGSCAVKIVGCQADIEQAAEDAVADAVAKVDAVEEVMQPELNLDDQESEGTDGDGDEGTDGVCGGCKDEDGKVYLVATGEEGESGTKWLCGKCRRIVEKIEEANAEAALA